MTKQATSVAVLVACAVWSSGCMELDLDEEVGESQAAVWVDWEAIAGSDANSAPAVASWGPERLDLFWRGSDNHLKHAWLAPGGQWSGVQDLGGQLRGAPAAVSWGPGRIDVFWRGMDSQLEHIAYPCYGQSWCRDDGWSNSEKLGGYLTTDPTVASWGEGRLDVFWTNSSSNLEHKWYENGWSGIQNLGGALASAPAAVSWGPGRIDVVWRGMTNGLEHTAYPCYGGSWCRGDGWANSENLGHSVTSDPAISSWGEDRLDVFWRGSAAGDIKQLVYDHGWGSVGSLGGDTTSAPAAVSWGFGRTDLFARDADGHTLIRRSWNPYVGPLCSNAMASFEAAAEQVRISYSSDCSLYNDHYRHFERRSESVISDCGAPSAHDWLAIADHYQNVVDEVSDTYDFCNRPEAVSERCPFTGTITVKRKIQYGWIVRLTTIYVQGRRCESDADVDLCNEYFADTNVFGDRGDRVIYTSGCYGPEY